jgi:diguanylate cyclase
MFPKMMNDNNFYTQRVARKDVAHCTTTIPMRWGSSLRSGKGCHGRQGWPACLCRWRAYWYHSLLRVDGGYCWPYGAFVWPHLAWQLAARSSDPHASETHNLKADAVLSGVWIALIGVNMLPSIALAMMVFITTMGAGGPLCLAGVVLMAVACLVTLQLTGITIAPDSSPLIICLTVPVLLLYPSFFLGELP